MTASKSLYDSLKTRTRARTHIALGIAVLLIAITAAALLLRLHRSVPPPPEIDLHGVDPAIAAAITQARSEVIRDPASSSAWGRLATVLAVHEYDQPAEKCFAQAEQIDPKNPRWPYLQWMSLHEKDPQVPLDLLERAVRLFGDSSTAAPCMLAETLISRSQAPRAQPYLDEVVKRDPQNARALLDLARVAQARKDDRQAMAYLEKAAAAAPNLKVVHEMLAIVADRLNDHARSQSELQIAARLPAFQFPDPVIAEAALLRVGEKVNIQRARVMIDSGQPDAALALLQKTTQDYPRSDAAWFTQSAAQSARQDLDGAEFAMERAMELAPGDSRYEARLGTILVARGRYFDAANHFAEAARLRPTLASNFQNLGVCRVATGDFSSGIDAFRQATRLAPRSAEAHLNLALTLSRIGQTQEATIEARRTLDLAPANAAAKRIFEAGSAITRPASQPITTQPD